MARNRLNIKYIYVSSYTERNVERSCKLDIAILTEDLKYAEYEVITVSTKMTPKVMAAYHSIMADWQLTTRSKIYYHENVLPKEPVRMILKSLAQQFGVQCRRVTTDGMVRRLCHIHQNFINKHNRKLGKYVVTRKGDRNYVRKIWRKVVKGGLCPWITKEYDEYLASKGYAEILRRKQILRLGMYYIHESNVKRSYDMSSRPWPGHQYGGKPEQVTERPTENEPVQTDEFETGLFS